MLASSAIRGSPRRRPIRGGIKRMAKSKVTEHAKILWLAEAQTVTRGRLSCFACTDCLGPAEYYIVENHIWKRASEGCELGKRSMLCLRCLSKRLGRELKFSDFPECGINGWLCSDEAKRAISRELTDAMKRRAEGHRLAMPKWTCPKIELLAEVKPGQWVESNKERVAEDLGSAMEMTVLADMADNFKRPDQAIESAFAGAKDGVLILGFEGGFDSHWTVVRGITTTELILFDSWVYTTFDRRKLVWSKQVKDVSKSKEIVVSPADLNWIGIRSEYAEVNVT
jgi:hypothetical protein